MAGVARCGSSSFRLVHRRNCMSDADVAQAFHLKCRFGGNSIVRGDDRSVHPVNHAVHFIPVVHPCDGSIDTYHLCLGQTLPGGQHVLTSTAADDRVDFRVLVAVAKCACDSGSPSGPWDTFCIVGWL